MIDQNAIKTKIKALFDETKSKHDQQEAIDHFADELSNIIADAIKRGVDSAAVNYVLTAGNVPVTGTIKISTTK